MHHCLVLCQSRRSEGGLRRAGMDDGELPEDWRVKLRLVYREASLIDGTLFIEKIRDIG